MFTSSSRYARVESAVYVDGNGRQIVYKRLRILSDPRSLRTHEVRSEDRLDLLAHQYLGDPEQYWRIVDANRELMPGELTSEVGRRLRIPLLGG